ncbi:MAG: hypothetical protein AAFQ68_29165, partial [Bacteroidota bacterium]
VISPWQSFERCQGKHQLYQLSVPRSGSHMQQNLHALRQIGKSPHESRFFSIHDGSHAHDGRL